MKPSRIIFVLLLLLIAAVVLLPQGNTTTATAAISPLGIPAQRVQRSSADLQHRDRTYLENPPVLTPQTGPFLDQYGDTVIQQQIMPEDHHAPWVFNLKRPIAQVAPTLNTPVGLPTTFQSPLDVQYTTYLPLVMKNYPPNKIIYSIVFEDAPPIYDEPGIGITFTYQAMNDINAASTQNGVIYGLYNQTVFITSTHPPTRTNGLLDLSVIYTRYGLCAKIQAGQVDEVWIWTDGRDMNDPNPAYRHLPYSTSEYTINGPTYSIYAGDSLAPNCGKTVTTMLLNYDAVEANAVHSYGHTFDGGLLRFWGTPYGYQACDWVTPHYTSYSFYGWGVLPQCTGQYAANDTYAFTARPNSYNSNIGMCGDIHQPPNVDGSDTRQYYYSLPQSRNSRCGNWQWNGGTVTSISCSAWNCEVCPNEQSDPYGYYDCNDQRNAEKYYIWWLQKLPGLNNTSHDRTGALRPNYWALKFQ